MQQNKTPRLFKTLIWFDSTVDLRRRLGVGIGFEYWSVNQIWFILFFRIFWVIMLQCTFCEYSSTDLRLFAKHLWSRHEAECRSLLHGTQVECVMLIRLSHCVRVRSGLHVIDYRYFSRRWSCYGPDSFIKKRGSAGGGYEGAAPRPSGPWTVSTRERSIYSPWTTSKWQAAVPSSRAWCSSASCSELNPISELRCGGWLRLSCLLQ